MKLFKLLSISLYYVSLSVLLPLVSLADQGGDPPASLIENPLAGNVDSIFEFVEALLTNIVLPIGAVVVVFFIIYSGYLFVTAGGSEEKLKTAKQTFLWVVVGAAVLLGAWAIALAIQATVCQISPNC